MFFGGTPEEPTAPRDPGEDPVAIFDALLPPHRDQFRGEYDEALDAAHDLARCKQVRTLLRQWRLRAIAYRSVIRGRLMSA